MIQVNQLRKSFNNLEVLKGLDLHIAKGEFIAVVGASGAGKTTLLQLIGALDSIDSGEIEISGIQLAKLKDKQLAKFRNEKIGFVFQFHQLLPEFTALENICIPAYIKGTSKVEAEKEAMRLLESLQLTHRADHKPSELSGGEQQRVAVARALINKPALVLADEPSGNLDSKNADDLHQLFAQLSKEMGYTIVVVTHNEKLAAMADRTLHMQDGNILV
jgi:lipoprotein-releasing system ATP-binding protein